MQSYIRPGLSFKQGVNVVGLDVDGVLASSDAYMWTIFFTLRSFGFPVTDAYLPRIRRLQHENNCAWQGCFALLEELAADCDRSPPTFEQAKSRFEWVFHPHVEDPASAATNSNIVGLCASERCYVDRNWGDTLRRTLNLRAVFVATGRPRVDYDDFANRFELSSFVDLSSCREDYAGVVKPDPASLDWALAELEKSVEVDRSRVCYVGDTIVDIQAARAAGILSVGVPNPAHEDQQLAFRLLERADADIVVPNISMLTPTLLSLVRD